MTMFGHGPYIVEGVAGRQPSILDDERVDASGGDFRDERSKLRSGASLSLGHDGYSTQLTLTERL